MSADNATPNETGKPAFDFSLPGDAAREQRPPRCGRGLLWLVLALQVAVLVGLWRNGRAPAADPGRGGRGGLTAAQLRELAQKLEKQGLTEPAARTWIAYLDRRDGDAAGAAAIWYRIGRLRQDAGQYEKALECYYRSESFGKLDSLRNEIGRRIEECLEALGRFSALRYELAERVGVGPAEDAAGDEVLAEIGPEKITRRALDRYLEKMVEQQFARLAPSSPPELLKRQKEAVLKQYASDENRRALLSQLLAEELLYRKAREDKLTDDPAVRELLRRSERQILAEQALQRALAERIHITPGDVRMYYDAHPEAFTEPPAARVAHIVVPDAEKAKAVRNSLAAGRDFAELAAEVSEDETTAKNGGRIDGWIPANSTGIPGIGKCPAFLEAVFNTKPGTVAAADVTTPAGIHIIKVLERREARKKPFEEVRDDAWRQLRARKETEVREQLLNELRDRYDVVLHTSLLEKKPGKK